MLKCNVMSTNHKSSPTCFPTLSGHIFTFKQVRYKSLEDDLVVYLLPCWLCSEYMQVTCHLTYYGG